MKRTFWWEEGRREDIFKNLKTPEITLNQHLAVETIRFLTLFVSDAKCLSKTDLLKLISELYQEMEEY